MKSGRSKIQPVGIYLNNLRRKACSTVQAGTWKRRPVFISQERVKVFVGASFTQTSGTPCFIKMKPFFEIINSSMMVPIVSHNLTLKPKKHTWQNAYLAWKEPNDDDSWGERFPGTRDCFEAIYRNMIDSSKLNRLLERYTHTHTHTHTLPTWHCHMQLFHAQLATHTLATQHCHTHTHAHATLSHSTLSHTHTHTTHSHTTCHTHTHANIANICQHNSVTHTHETLSHTTLSHAHTRATLPHNIVMHNSSTHNSFTHNLSYTALSHTTLSRTALSHTIAFVWQAWPFVTLMFLLLGHRGASVWQAWHLVRLMALLFGRCGTSYFFSGTIFQCYWIQNQNRNPNFVLFRARIFSHPPGQVT